MSLPLNFAAKQARKDFAPATLRALEARRIDLVGIQMLPNEKDGSWINGERAYTVADHGTGRVWTFAQVLAAAKA